MLTSRNPLEKYEELDPKTVEHWKNLQGFAFAEGALSSKAKFLIAMSIDVVGGSVEGATVLGQRAMKLGASKEEVLEALRVAFSIGGSPALFTAALVVQNLFK